MFWLFFLHLNVIKITTLYLKIVCKIIKNLSYCDYILILKVSNLHRLTLRENATWTSGWERKFWWKIARKQRLLTEKFRRVQEWGGWQRPWWISNKPFSTTELLLVANYLYDVYLLNYDLLLLWKSKIKSTAKLYAEYPIRKKS